MFWRRRTPSSAPDGGPCDPVVDAGDRTVWRVGRAPDPLAWIDRQYAGHQRWVDG